MMKIENNEQKRMKKWAVNACEIHEDLLKIVNETMPDEDRIV